MGIGWWFPTQKSSYAAKILAVSTTEEPFAELRVNSDSRGDLNSKPLNLCFLISSVLQRFLPEFTKATR
jgi:hypothetical protein